jgi:hypothetical protein
MVELPAGIIDHYEMIGYQVRIPDPPLAHVAQFIEEYGIAPLYRRILTVEDETVIRAWGKYIAWCPSGDRFISLC